jgi:ArsR family transcriptional regulator
MEKTVEILKALGDENRFRIVMLLKARKMCVCEIYKILDISGATLSAHLKILKNAGLVTQRRDGRWIEYYINDDEKVKAILDQIENSIKKKDVIRKDRGEAMKINKEQCADGFSKKK